MSRLCHLTSALGQKAKVISLSQPKASGKAKNSPRGTVGHPPSLFLHSSLTNQMSNSNFSVVSFWEKRCFCRLRGLLLLLVCVMCMLLPLQLDSDVLFVSVWFSPLLINHHDADVAKWAGQFLLIAALLQSLAGSSWMWQQSDADALKDHSSSFSKAEWSFRMVFNMRCWLKVHITMSRKTWLCVYVCPLQVNGAASGAVVV